LVLAKDKVTHCLSQTEYWHTENNEHLEKLSQTGVIRGNH